MAIFGLILPIGEVALGRVCVSSLHSWLVYENFHGLLFCFLCTRVVIWFLNDILFPKSCVLCTLKVILTSLIRRL